MVSPRCRPGQCDGPVQPRLMYANGQGVPQDYAEAVKWYRLAADQGDADAQSYLGVMYAKGRASRRTTLRREVVSPCCRPG